MMRDDRFSDEKLSAYIDNELSPSESKLIEEALKQNQDLSMRMGTLRKVRDLVRSAYPHSENTNVSTIPRAPARGHRKRTRLAIAASLLIGLCVGWLGHHIYPQDKSLLQFARNIQQTPINITDRSPHKIVIHITTSDDYKLASVLEEVEVLLQAYVNQPEAVKVELLTNGPGLNLVRADKSPFPGEIKRLQTQFPNLQFSACNKTITRLKLEQGIDPPLLPEAVVVQSALREIIERRKDGWTYIQI